MTLCIRQNSYGNGRICLRLSDEMGIPHSNITVNVPSESLSEAHVFLHNNLTDEGGSAVDVFDALLNQNVLRPTGRQCNPVNSFCTYHEAELHELDLDGYELLD